jgi:hypothetical protein
MQIKFNHEGHQKNEKYISDSGKDRSSQYPVMMQQSLLFTSFVLPLVSRGVIRPVIEVGRSG